MRGRSALLVLETGEVFEGTAWGGSGGAVGEVVFNTSLTGYQEVLTDPSYAGQLVVMTYPHIGNYGVNPADVESARIRPAGFVVRDLSRRPSNFRSRASLDQYLKGAGIPAIGDVDTRALTRRIREGGAVMGLIAQNVGRDDVPALLTQLRSEPSYGEIDFVRRVTCERRLRVLLGEAAAPLGPRPLSFEPSSRVPSPRSERHVVVMDFGVKYSILRNLIGSGFQVTLVPSGTSAAEVLALEPVGVLLSNGPGDPARLERVVEEVRGLLGQVPVYGICLGHQLLAMALGAKTFKLKYGHRGSNQPVLDTRSGRVVITSQNHGYAVDPKGMSDRVELTHLNLNDGTVEGLSHRDLTAVSVQYHPEAGPGPSDGRGFFDEMASCLLPEGR